jgi:DNA-binding response OmpR family regulator
MSDLCGSLSQNFWPLYRDSRRQYMNTLIERSTLHNAKRSGVSPHRIMISGTHNDTRYMMRVLLEMWGYEVIEAAGEVQTVRVAEAEHPELILVDTANQFEEDLKIVKSLRGSHVPASVPVIVLSGYPQADYQKAAFENGATGHLVKPLDLDLLEDYLETCLDE